MIGLGLSPAADRSAHALRLSWVLMAGLMGATVLALGLGAASVSLPRVLADLLAGRGVAPQDHLVLMQIRLPRLIMGGLIGAALGVSGALMQGLFRNPLADPGLVGVGAGAGLGAVLAIVLGASWAISVPLAAFVGAWGAVVLLYRVATRGGQTSVAVLLLAGVALAALAGAATGVLVYLADDRQLRDLTFWSMGSVAGASWEKCLWAGAFILPVLLLAPRLGAGLNALALGEAAARHIGHPVQRLKTLTVLAVAAATGAATAAAGGIGFIGIVVPHLLRLASGPDHRHLLPNAALLGATLLILADTAARLVVAPAELPIGILTALLGAPVFLWILLRQARWEA
ncbi:MAG TPA: iron ABC transporter permease [Gemmobacter sp.]|nr:iron ABC transporter permease [Gemmobacter sp.]